MLSEGKKKVDSYLLSRAQFNNEFQLAGNQLGSDLVCFFLNSTQIAYLLITNQLRTF